MCHRQQGWLVSGGVRPKVDREGGTHEGVRGRSHRCDRHPARPPARRRGPRRDRHDPVAGQDRRPAGPGGPAKTEDDPPDLDLPAKGRSGADALRYLEDAVTGIDWAEGIVLRYGGFYGPGTSVSADPEAATTKAIRKRRFPIVGDGGGIWSYVHIEDAASATVAAVDHGAPGIYNVVDDEPAPVREWLPFLAEQMGAKKPMRVPRFVGRLLAGEAPVLQMTEVRGASNAKAKRVLGWQPRWSTWRVRLAHGLRARTPAPSRGC